MSPGSSTESYPAFARIGLRENPGKNLNQKFVYYFNLSSECPLCRALTENREKLRQYVTDNEVNRKNVVNGRSLTSAQLVEVVRVQRNRNHVRSLIIRERSYCTDDVTAKRYYYKQNSRVISRNSQSLLKQSKICFPYFMEKSIFEILILVKSGLSANDDSGYNCSANDRFLWPSKVNVDICSSEKINTFASAHIEGKESHNIRNIAEAKTNSVRASVHTPAQTITPPPPYGTFSEMQHCENRSPSFSKLFHVHQGKDPITIDSTDKKNIELHTTRKRAQALRNKSFEVHEKVHCVASEGGGIRRADIVALDKTNSKGFILDPTVRFEMSQTQPSEVNKEKQQIYEPTIPYFREKYQMEGTWEVHGLMIGERGTIPIDQL
ncbi:hypothetical protein ANN_24956 [Periplaneta americana]|uniref:Uncharacterized protein n=1 Tax=Periplaneta americana TaxID=6978 RepID=A0ABQ8S083_PERAM|nr:hypothetical protein ANN_24956 [Periplaneta americana]